MLTGAKDWCVSLPSYAFLQGSSGVKCSDLRKWLSNRYFISQGCAGEGFVWHGAGLAFRTLKLCQIELLVWFSSCVEIKTGLLFIHSLSHCSSSSPLLQESVSLCRLSLPPAALTRPRFPWCTGITTDLSCNPTFATYCVTLNEIFNVTEPQFPHPSNGNNNNNINVYFVERFLKTKWDST